MGALLLKASVVVVSRDQKELLERALIAIINQDSPKKDFEAIVIDDGSIDGTNEMVAGLQRENSNLKYFNQGKKGLAAGRNKGIALSESDIVAFTDNDCIAARNWLKEIVCSFSEESVLGVEGKTIAGGRKLFHNAPENLCGGKFVGCNLAFRKKIFSEVGLFDEGMSFWREETDLAFRVLGKGKIVFNSKAIINHPLKRVKYSSIIQSLKFIRNDLTLLRRHPEKYLQYLGFPFKKELAFSAVSWVLLLLFAGFAISANMIPALLSIAAIILWKLVPVIGKEFSAKDLAVFVPLSFARDILFFPALVYYLTLTCLPPQKSANK